MKNKLLVFLLIFSTAVLKFTFAGVEPDGLVNNSFLFCLKSTVPQLKIEHTKNRVTVDNPILNEFVMEYNIINIEPWLPHATDLDYDGDIYLNRIYIAYISEDSRQAVKQVRDDIQSLQVIHSSELQYMIYPLYTPNDPSYNQQCSLPAVKASQAWDFWDIENGIMPGNPEVLVAIVDSGVDWHHSDLVDNIWNNLGEDVDGDGHTIEFIGGSWVLDPGDLNGIDDDGNGYDDDLIGWDTSGINGVDDNDPMVPGSSGNWDHGTHVAGIAAAATDNNVGMASTSFNSKIISIKTKRDSADPNAGYNSSETFQGILYAAKAGYYAGTFSIINCSWGNYQYNSYNQSVMNTAHNQWGAVIVAAAGNGDDDTGGEDYSPHYPSSYANVISVAAIGCSGSWGHWATYHETVDISAPGESVYSTIPGNGYASYDGSSMASPNVVSCFALLKSFYPDWDNTQLEDRILETANSFIYEINDEEYLQGMLGEGMIDIHKAIGSLIYPNLYYLNQSLILQEGDGDNVLNPGESAQMRVTLGNEEGWLDANFVTTVLRCDDPEVTIMDSTANYSTIYSGGMGVNIADLFAFEISENAGIGDIEFDLVVTAEGAEGYTTTYHISFPVSISLNHEGWPVEFLLDTLYNVETSPLVLDVTENGENEIIFGDYSGYLYAVDSYGNMIESDLFPFDTGNQIWGSPAAADIDNDGHIEVISTSKSKHLFILDPVDQIVQVDYNANQFLMGSPAIGNMDDDEELEIVFGGFSSPGKIFAINPDGTDVDGFPYELGEKIMRGISLADVDGNGKLDIICATDSDHIWLIYDNLTVADGFPFVAEDKLRAAPTVIEQDGEFIILAGSRDFHLYGVNGDGSLRFAVETGNYVSTSPAVMMMEDGIGIFFGSEDGWMYGVDMNGEDLPGWPIETYSSFFTSPVISDLDGDDDMEIFAVNEMGMIFAFQPNGMSQSPFPFSSNVNVKGSPTISDTDGDSDLELMFGSVESMINIDLKESGESENYWNMHRGNNKRTGFYESSTTGCGECELGDVNCDGSMDILDVVRTVYIVVNDPDDVIECELLLSDVNQDSNIDVLDMVTMVNMILGS